MIYLYWCLPIIAVSCWFGILTHEKPEPKEEENHQAEIIKFRKAGR